MFPRKRRMRKLFALISFVEGGGRLRTDLQENFYITGHGRGADAFGKICEELCSSETEGQEYREGSQCPAASQTQNYYDDMENRRIVDGPH